MVEKTLWRIKKKPKYSDRKDAPQCISPEEARGGQEAIDSIVINAAKSTKNNEVCACGRPDGP